MRPSLLCCQILALLHLLSAPVAYAEGEVEESQTGEKSQWTVLAGYGLTHKGMGSTRAHVETADFILRYSRYLTDEMGQSWYRVRHAISIELPVHLVVDPVTSPMLGINVLANWTFTASKRLRPYFFGGGGFIYTNAEIPGLGSKYNGNYQGGAGILLGIRGKYFLNAEYRIHHISNLNTKKPNDPLNSSKFLIGVTAPFSTVF